MICSELGRKHGSISVVCFPQVVNNKTTRDEQNENNITIKPNLATLFTGNINFIFFMGKKIANILI